MAEPKDLAVVPTEDATEEQETTETPTSAEAQEGGETEGESDANEGEHQGDKPKRKGGWQRKIERLERENEFWRQQALTQTAKPVQAQPAPEAVAEEVPEPDPNDFETTADYLAAVRKYDREQIKRDLQAEMDKREKAREQQSQQKAVAQTWQQKVAAAAKANPDFNEIAQDAIASFNRYDSPAVAAVADYIREDSEDGTKLLAHLGEHPEEVQRLSGMSPRRALAAVGLIEEKLAGQKIEASKEDDEDERPAPPPVRLPPPPPTPVRKPSSTASVDLNDPKLDYNTWVKERNRQLEAKRK